jgi:hypothetical protein
MVAPGLLVHGECPTRFGGRLTRDVTRVRSQVPSYGERGAAGGTRDRRFAVEPTRNKRVFLPFSRHIRLFSYHRQAGIAKRPPACIEHRREASTNSVRDESPSAQVQPNVDAALYYAAPAYSPRN